MAYFIHLMADDVSMPDDMVRRNHKIAMFAEHKQAKTIADLLEPLYVYRTPVVKHNYDPANIAGTEFENWVKELTTVKG